MLMLLLDFADVRKNTHDEIDPSTQSTNKHAQKATQINTGE